MCWLFLFSYLILFVCLYSSAIAPGTFNRLLVTLGANDGGWYSRARGLSGLANAVMIAEPNSPFLKRWYEMYRTFDYRQWDYHSCKLPMILSQQYPDEVVTLATAGFFLPQAEQMHRFFSKDDWNFRTNWGAHLWHHVMNATFTRIQDWSAEDIMQQKTSFGRLARAAWAKPAEGREIEEIDPRPNHITETETITSNTVTTNNNNHHHHTQQPTVQEPMLAPSVGLRLRV